MQTPVCHYSGLLPCKHLVLHRLSLTFYGNAGDLCYFGTFVIVCSRIAVNIISMCKPQSHPATDNYGNCIFVQFPIAFYISNDALRY
jgi:hypothetical protein